jgi:tRNA(adenine34) deaminase
MNEHQVSAAAKTPRGQSRRSFVGGIILGGTCGSLAAWAALRGRASVYQDVTGPMSNLSLASRTLDHERFMREAIARAKKVPRRPFGAVIVLAEKAEVVADGINRSEKNPTFHGELDAINSYAELHSRADWSGLVLYTTAEPCPMCQTAVIWAGIGMVVFCSTSTFFKILGWGQVDIRAEEVVRRTAFRRCVLLGGVLEEECNALFRGATSGPHPRQEG